MKRKKEREKMDGQEISRNMARTGELTEKEKAAAGLLYDANYDAGLAAERAACKDLCFAYNSLPPSREEEHAAILRRLLGRTGEHFHLEQPIWLDYGYHTRIGENFYCNHNCIFLDAAEITFGDNVFVAPNCSFYTAGHPFDVAQRNQGLEYAYPIHIGSNVWIGGNVTVLPGVTIGDGAVIGAGSVVNRDIPADVLAAGNPCRVIRPILPQDKTGRAAPL